MTLCIRVSLVAITELTIGIKNPSVLTFFVCVPPLSPLESKKFFRYLRLPTMVAFSKQRSAGVFSVFSFLAVMLSVIHFSAGATKSEVGLDYIIYKEENNTQASSSSSSSYSSPRKLLSRSSAIEEPNRIYGDSCTSADIVINQGPTASLPNGIPSYTVEITNVCVTGCDVSGIHIRCGWFSSARLINPKIFRRLHYNDCLVNDGKPLIYGGTISFEYSNTFSYPLSVFSVVC